MLFNDFPCPSLQFHDFPCLEIEIINSTTFQVFCDSYEPWSDLCHDDPNHDIKYSESICIYIYTRRRHGICLIWQITLLSMMDNAWHMNETIINTCKQKVCFFLYLVNKVKSNTSVKITQKKRKLLTAKWYSKFRFKQSTNGLFTSRSTSKRLLRKSSEITLLTNLCRSLISFDFQSPS